MSILDVLSDGLDARGLRLRKAKPRSPGRLVLELHDARGLVCAGQWFSDAALAQRAARELQRLPGRVELLDDGHSLVQHDGADLALPALHDRVTAPGAVLVTHRAERRAVVRNSDHSFTKLVRPGRTTAVAAALRVEPRHARLPTVLEVDDRQGMVTMAALEGRTLHDVLADERLSDGDVAAEANRVGTALRSLHETDVAPHASVHGPAGELEASAAWLVAASSYGLLPAGRWEQRMAQAAELLRDGSPSSAPLHRDLHDKQVLVAPGLPVGLLDLDLSARGDPALDLANLLVHMGLRRLQGHCSATRAQGCAAALVEGYAPDQQMLLRLPGYAATAQLRLAGVYAFRNADPHLVDDLLGRDLLSEAMTRP